VHLHVGDGPATCVALYLLSGCRRPFVFVDDSHVEDTLYWALVEVASSMPEAAILLDDTVLGCSREPDRALRRFLDATIAGYEPVVGSNMTLLMPL
jgi:hypothetical protein